MFGEDPQQFKRLLYDALLHRVMEQLTALQEAIKETQASANEDTKSSAGDKYETGRAMAQLEIEKLMGQLQEKKLAHQLLSRLPQNAKDTAEPGAVVHTNIGTFYISINGGEVVIAGKKLISISPASPLAKTILGKIAGEKCSFNQKVISIISII